MLVLLSRFLVSAIAPRATVTRSLISMSAATTAPNTLLLPGDLLVREHVLNVPLDHENPDGEQLDLFVRELVPASKASDDSLPYLLYLQGGPGFPSGRPTGPPSGWQKSALLASYRVLLLDQRGTGRSSPVTAQGLAGSSAEAQAAYMTHFRADSIVKDCEVVRKALAGGKKLTLLGQSYGGFCILSYLSRFPESIERALFTCGLAPVGRSADEVYRATYKRMEERNKRFYLRYPENKECARTFRPLHLVHTKAAHYEMPAVPHNSPLLPSIPVLAGDAHALFAWTQWFETSSALSTRRPCSSHVAAL